MKNLLLTAPEQSREWGGWSLELGGGRGWVMDFIIGYRRWWKEVVDRDGDDDHGSVGGGVILLCK